METTNHLFGLPGLGGIIFMAAGIFMYAFPPKKINSLYGYRTKSSMKSQDRWDFAQKYSAIRLVFAGLFLCLFSGCGLMLTIGAKAEMVMGIAMSLAAVFYILITTEKALKDKFPTDS